MEKEKEEKPSLWLFQGNFGKFSQFLRFGALQPADRDYNSRTETTLLSTKDNKMAKKLTKTDRRAYRFCTIEELVNLHDDAVSCDDFAWADKIKAELTARGWKAPEVVHPENFEETSEPPF